MDNNSIYTSENFIARWIAGDLTKTETEGLNEFMSREPEAIHFFEGIKQAWFGANALKLPKGLSGAKRWAHFLKNLNLHNKSANGKH